MVHVIEPGTHYRVETTGGKSIEVLFCHRDGITNTIVDGIMSEDLLEILIKRQDFFIVERKSTSVTNLNVMNHLRQALGFMKERNFSKRKKVENSR